MVAVLSAKTVKRLPTAVVMRRVNPQIRRIGVPGVTQAEARLIDAVVIRTGRAGAVGGELVPYTHLQETPAATWTVDHNMGRRPLVSLLDADGAEIVGSVIHLTLNRVMVYFVQTMVGRALCL